MKLRAATPAFFETASHVVSTEVEIGATVDAAWTALNDHGSWPDWFDGCSSAEATPPNWSAPGDTRTVRINGLKVHERAIIVEPGADMAFTILRWPLPIARCAAERIELQDASRDGEDRCNLIYTGAFELTAIGRLVWPLLRDRVVDGWGSGFEALHGHLHAEDTGGNS